MSDKYYITTPIYYVNDVPHIGHAYTSLACDMLARYMRLAGREVKFLTGTDEHGQKVEKSALNNNMTPIDFTNKTSARFRELSNLMNFSNDDFIRTTEERHKKFAKQFWKFLSKNGDIYLDKYSGWYSTRDEAFYAEAELDSDGNAPTGAPVSWVEESSYFFALSKYQDKLLEFYENNPDFIKPESRRNEVISFVKGGLKDLSISRTSFSWGIDVPEVNSSDGQLHIMYVWLDALTNYISALGGTGTAEYEKFWPANVHVVGKDILRFHAVYWPAFLMSANLPLPQTIFAHGWWTNEGQKISKSVGNVIDPYKLIEKYGQDPVRYYLMKEVIFGNDGNYSDQSFVSRVNSELSNKIGNLVQRTCSFVYKNCQAKVPNFEENLLQVSYEKGLLKIVSDIVQTNDLYMDKIELNAYLDNIIKIAEHANSYIDSKAPWKLKNENPQQMNIILAELLEVIRYIGILLQPVMPDSADKILTQISINSESRLFKHLTLEHSIKPLVGISEPQVIFPRIG